MIQAEFENGIEESKIKIIPKFKIQEIEFQNGADEDDAWALSTNYSFIEYKS